MSSEQMVDWLEGIIFGGVAVTADALEHATDGQGLTFTQWRAILVVGDREDGCRVGEAARFLRTSLPAASRLLRRLERRELLVLERDERDRRATLARLTPAGADLRSSVLAYRRREIAAIVAQVTPPASAGRALRDLAATFDARGHTPPPHEPRPSTSE